MLRSCLLAVGALLLAAPAASAATAEIAVRPLGPMGETGAPTGATIRLNLPANGQVRSGLAGVPRVRTWAGPSFGEGCRVKIDLEAYTVAERDRGLQRFWPTVAFRNRDGIHYARSAVELGDDGAIFGYTRFSLPNALATPEQRLVYVYATVQRGLDHCIRPQRVKGRPIAAAALKSVRFVPSQ